MKTVLVTGATGEIGQCIARHLASQPIRMIIAARDAAQLNNLRNELKIPHAEIIPIDFDYSKKNTYEKIGAMCQEGLDGCVLIPPRIPATAECMPSDDEWINIFHRVFVQPLELFKTLRLCLMKANPSKVVVISGISSKVLLSNYAANGAIRAAWNAQIKAMAFEYGPQGIHINALSLGGVMTETFTQKVAQEAQQKDIPFSELMREKTQNVPLQKYASLDDVAHAVDALLGPFTNHMTGSNFMCDGGFLRAY